MTIFNKKVLRRFI